MNIREIRKGIRNLVEYAHIVWDDHDWDYAFLLDLIEFKLGRMAKEIGGKQRLENADLVSDQMLMVRDAIRRYREDNYLAQERAGLDERWGEYGCPVCGKFVCHCFPCEDKPACHLVAIHENVHSLEDDLLCSEQYHDLSVRQMLARKADLDSVFDMMKANIEGWWD